MRQILFACYLFVRLLYDRTYDITFPVIHLEDPYKPNFQTVRRLGNRTPFDESSFPCTRRLSNITAPHDSFIGEEVWETLVSWVRGGYVSVGSSPVSLHVYSDYHPV